MSQSTDDLLARAHHARMEVRRIQAEMRACVCQHELALEHCTASVVGDGLWWRQLTDRDGQPYRREDPSGKVFKDWLPCWKGEMVPSGNPYPLPPMEWEAYGWSDERPGGWCGPCQKRETIRKGLEPARRRLAGLKSAIWRAAKKCAEGVVSQQPCPGCLACCAPIRLHPQLLADARKVGIEACDGSGLLPAKRSAGGGR